MDSPSSKTAARLFDGSKLYLNKVGTANESVEDIVSFKELLDVENFNLERVFLTADVWESSFICNKFPKVPITLACHWAPPKKEGKKQSTLCTVHGLSSCQCSNDVKRDVEIILPHFPEDVEGNVHSKLLILVYQSHLRVVVTTANFEEREWDSLGQVVWCQDFQKLSDTSATQSTDFGDTLVSFVEAIDASGIVSILKQYDYSTAKVSLIVSVPGLHKDAAAHKFGHLKLKSLLASQQWPTEEYVAKDGSTKQREQKTTLDYQTTTIGAVKKEWVSGEFLASCLGKDSVSEDEDSVNTSFRVLFPTHQDVSASTYPQGAHSICCWDRAGATRKYLHHSDHAKRSGLLLKSKVLVRRLESNPSHGWVYAGSHNLSASAWGKVSNGSLNMHNYEVGVFFPLSQSLDKMAIPFDVVKPYLEKEKPWMIPTRPKVVIENGTNISASLFVLPQKHIFIPNPDVVRTHTGAKVLLPPQPCINIARFSTCKYGASCRYSHTYSPVEVSGTAQQVFEACRLIMSALTSNPFSMGAAITVGNVVVQGWMWSITTEWKYRMFIPDPQHPLAKQFLIDVVHVNEPADIQLESCMTDLNFLSSAGLTMVPAKNYEVKVNKANKAETQIQDTNSFTINGAPTTFTKTVYIFGTKSAIKSATSDVICFVKKPKSPKDAPTDHQ